jgi:hypothetical protein
VVALDEALKFPEARLIGHDAPLILIMRTIGVSSPSYLTRSGMGKDFGRSRLAEILRSPP